MQKQRGSTTCVGPRQGHQLYWRVFGVCGPVAPPWARVSTRTSYSPALFNTHTLFVAATGAAGASASAAGAGAAGATAYSGAEGQRVRKEALSELRGLVPPAFTHELLQPLLDCPQLLPPEPPAAVAAAAAAAAAPALSQQQQRQQAAEEMAWKSGGWLVVCGHCDVCAACCVTISRSHSTLSAGAVASPLESAAPGVSRMVLICATHPTVVPGPPCTPHLLLILLLLLLLLLRLLLLFLLPTPRSDAAAGQVVPPAAAAAAAGSTQPPHSTGGSWGGGGWGGGSSSSNGNVGASAGGVELAGASGHGAGGGGTGRQRWRPGGGAGCACVCALGAAPAAGVGVGAAGEGSGRQLAGGRWRAHAFRVCRTLGERGWGRGVGCSLCALGRSLDVTGTCFFAAMRPTA